MCVECAIWLRTRCGTGGVETCGSTRMTGRRRISISVLGAKKEMSVEETMSEVSL